MRAPMQAGGLWPVQRRAGPRFNLETMAVDVSRNFPDKVGGYAVTYAISSSSRSTAVFNRSSVS